jgi:hypothetical protein
MKEEGDERGRSRRKRQDGKDGRTDWIGEQA